MQNLSKFLNLKEEKLKRQQQYNVAFNPEEIFDRLKKKAVKLEEAKVNISQKQFISICRAFRNITLRQPSLLRLNGPMIIATGTVGHYTDLCNIFLKCGNPDLFNYLFLGDYTGKGNSSIQCLMLLFYYKIKLEFNFFMLRGCFQAISFARGYNLYEECSQRYSPKAWTQACEAMCSLPFAAIIDNQVFCVHGGISPTLKAIQQINKIPRPLDTPEIGMPCDLIWSDPAYKQDSLLWCKNQRGFSYTFHHNVAEAFLKDNRLIMICRAHQIAFNGFQFNSNKSCATITSLANYCGLYNNSAAVMNVDFHGNIYFKMIKERQFFPFQRNVEESLEQYFQRIKKEKKLIRKKKQEEALRKKIQKREEEKQKKQQAEQQKMQQDSDRQQIQNYQSKGNLKQMQKTKNQRAPSDDSRTNSQQSQQLSVGIQEIDPDIDMLDRMIKQKNNEEDQQESDNQL